MCVRSQTLVAQSASDHDGKERDRERAADKERGVPADKDKEREAGRDQRTREIKARIPSREEQERSLSELSLALTRARAFDELAQVYRAALCSQLENTQLWYKLALALVR